MSTTKCPENLEKKDKNNGGERKEGKKSRELET